MRHRPYDPTLAPMYFPTMFLTAAISFPLGGVLCGAVVAAHHGAQDGRYKTAGKICLLSGGLIFLGLVLLTLTTTRPGNTVADLKSVLIFPPTVEAFGIIIWGLYNMTKVTRHDVS